MAATSRFSFGDVVLVPFPFTDQSGTKKRPAVVVSSHSYNASRRHIVIMAITSQTDLIASGDKRDLLPLGTFNGIDIVTARESVERLEATGKT